MHLSPFAPAIYSTCLANYENLLALMSEYDQSVVITRLSTQTRCCVTYREGKLSDVVHKGDGIMGQTLPNYVIKALFPQRLDTRLLYMHGFISFSEVGHDVSSFTTDLIHILRDPISFKENKKRLKFFATQCFDQDYPDLNLLESLDLLEDNIETSVELATVHSLTDVITNLYERDSEKPIAFDAYSVREVSYNCLTMPWTTDVEVNELVIPFDIAKEIARK